MTNREELITLFNKVLNDEAVRNAYPKINHFAGGVDFMEKIIMEVLNACPATPSGEIGFKNHIKTLKSSFKF